MSASTPSSDPRLGSLGIDAVLATPPLPNLVAEWAAILPLVCHLASHRDDYVTTGDVALQGRLSIGLFPRLGTLSGLSRLLARGTKFLDYASTKGDSSQIVWDVEWGSSFPCANGAASTAISKTLLSRATSGATFLMPETLPSQANKGSLGSERTVGQLSIASTSSSKSCHTRGARRPQEGAVRRFQVLNVYQLYRKTAAEPPSPPPRQNSPRLWLSRAGQAMWLISLTGFLVFLVLFGAYGSAALISCTLISQMVARTVRIHRPAGYLRNNEAHDACMLVAAHENATEWHLYIGERAIADTLLNKPMFAVAEGKLIDLAASWFWFAHLLQFLAMTFVTAQKGWDGVMLLVILAVHRGFRWLMGGSSGLAAGWLDGEGVGARVQSFEFGSRYAMMGAIQVFSKSRVTCWMDRILVPHPRREAWLRRLRGEDVAEVLDAHDQKWLDFASEASIASANIL
ncbi:hypothetical protein Micbo1qcDRAFT_103972, partial [Microdochium bolleyi]